MARVKSTFYSRACVSDARTSFSQRGGGRLGASRSSETSTFRELPQCGTALGGLKNRLPGSLETLRSHQGLLDRWVIRTLLSGGVVRRRIGGNGALQVTRSGFKGVSGESRLPAYRDPWRSSRRCVLARFRSPRRLSCHCKRSRRSCRLIKDDDDIREKRNQRCARNGALPSEGTRVQRRFSGIGSKRGVPSSV